MMDRPKLTDITLVGPAEAVCLEMSKGELATVILALLDEERAGRYREAAQSGDDAREILKMTGHASVTEFEADAEERAYSLALDAGSARRIGHALLPSWSGVPFRDRPESHALAMRLQMTLPKHWGQWYDPPASHWY